MKEAAVDKERYLAEKKIYDAKKAVIDAEYKKIKAAKNRFHHKKQSGAQPKKRAERRLYTAN